MQVLEIKKTRWSHWRVLLEVQWRLNCEVAGRAKIEELKSYGGEVGRRSGNFER